MRCITYKHQAGKGNLPASQIGSHWEGNR